MSNIFNKARENKKSVNVYMNNKLMLENKNDIKNPMTTIKKNNPNKNIKIKEPNKNNEEQIQLQKKQERDLGKKAIKMPNNNNSPGKKKNINIFRENNIKRTDSNKKNNINTKNNDNNIVNNNNSDKNNNNSNKANNISKNTNNQIKDDIIVINKVRNSKNIINDNNINNDEKDIISNIDKHFKEKEKYEKNLEIKLRHNSKEKFNVIQKKEKKNDFLKASINLDIENILNSSPKKEENIKKNNFIFNNNNNNINNLNPHTENIFNKYKSINPGMTKPPENHTIIKNRKNNEPYKLKDLENLKESEKNILNTEQKKKISNSNVIIFQSINKNITEDDKKGRTIKKKNTLQNQGLSNLSVSPFSNENNFERKYSLNENKSLKNSVKDSLKKSTSSINSNNYIIIPLINRKKENNCFLNVIIQSFFFLGEFRKELLEVNSLLGRKSRTIQELYKILNSYANEQQKNKENKNQIEPVISVNELRNYLNNIYHQYLPGEAGDPMETIGKILDIIHRTYCKTKNIDLNKDDCKCPSHQNFYLKLVDIISCPHCNVRKVQIYDKDCFMCNIFIKDISKKLHGKNYTTYKTKLFSKIKEYNETYENENKIKIPGCNCNGKMLSLYEKKLKLNGPCSTYLIINITWAEDFPNMLEILKCYILISMSDNIENLFTFGEELRTKLRDIFYLKSIILYGLYHYVCVLYMKDQRKWVVIDDITKKYIKNYFELIDFLLRNHLMPVGLIYSKERKDELRESEIKSNTLNREEYKKLFDFCKEVDVRRGLKISDIVVSKNSFNETNENYLNNNYFYKSIISFDSPNSSNKTNNKYLNSSSNKNIENNSDNKNINQKSKNNNIDNNDNKKNNTEKNTNNNCNSNFFKGVNILGNINNNNMKQGILFFPSSHNDKKNNEKSGQNEEENDLKDFGKNYVE